MTQGRLLSTLLLLLCGLAQAESPAQRIITVEEPPASYALQDG